MRRETVTLLDGEPQQRNAVDLRLYAAVSGPGASPMALPAPAMPDTAVADAIESERPNAVAGLLAVRLLLVGLVRPRRRR